jgi:hypothetical protein
MYIHMYSIVRNNLLLRFLSYFVVRSLRMATSWNMYEPDKVKYILVQYVHLLVLRDCNHSWSTEIVTQKWQKRRSTPSIHICTHKTTKVLLKKIRYSFWSTSVQYNFYQTPGSSLKKHCPFLSKSPHYTTKKVLHNTGVKWLLIYVFICTHSVTYSNTGLVQNCTSKIKSKYKYWLGWSTIK